MALIDEIRHDLAVRFMAAAKVQDNHYAVIINQLDRIENKIDAVIFKPPINTISLMHCFEHIKTGEKLHAIRYLREATGLGLKEAKDMVEIIMSS